MKAYIISSLLLLFSLTCYSQEDIFSFVREGNLNNIKKAVKDNPALINAVNSNGHSPLILACYIDQKEIVTFLLDNGANINYQMDMGSAVHAVAFKGNASILSLLIEKGADLDIVDNNRTSALHYAVLGAHVSCVKLLLDNNVSRISEDATGKTAFEYAKELGNKEILIEFNKKKR